MIKEKLSFIDFSAFSSGSHFAQWSKTILAILVVSHRSNIPDVRLKLAQWCRKSYHFFFLFLALIGIMFIGVEQFYLFVRKKS